MRVFIAIDIPENIKAQITSIYGELPGGRWVPESNLHLTLQFLGDISDSELNKIYQIVTNINFTPFSLQLSGAGKFKNGQLWLGIKKSEELNSLYNKLYSKLILNDFILEKRKFIPHITIARSKKSRFEPYIYTLESFKSDKFIISEIGVFNSKLKPTGAEYTKLI